MTSICSLFAHSVLMMALLLALFQVRRWKQYWPVPYVLAAIMIVLPVTHWLVIEFSRGYFSDVSMATILVCLVYIASAMRPVSIAIDHSLKLFVLVVCIILFPSSMGTTEYDLFSLGFPSEKGFNYLVVALAAFGLLAWYKQATQLAIYIVLVLSSFSMGIYESQNIWVYMVDPIVMLIFVVGYLNVAIQTVFKFLKHRLVKDA